MISAKQLHENAKDLDLLYVEDDDLLRAQMQGLFAELFRQVDTAENGQAGLQKYMQRLEHAGKPYDLVITDINMPLMNGIEMTKKIYQESPLQSVVVISAHSDSDYLVELLHIGVSNFLIKPVNYETMLTTLYKTTQVLKNERLVKRHYREIEALNAELSLQAEALKQSNDALLEKNIAIEKSMRIIEGMHHKNQLNYTVNLVQKKVKAVDEEPAEESEKVLMPDTYHYLSEVESIINEIALSYVYRAVKPDLLKDLGLAITTYALALPKTFETVKVALQDLAVAVSVPPQYTSAEELARVYTMLESFFFIYTKWKHELSREEPEAIELFIQTVRDEVDTLIALWHNKM